MPGRAIYLLDIGPGFPVQDGLDIAFGYPKFKGQVPLAGAPGTVAGSDDSHLIGIQQKWSVLSPTSTVGKPSSFNGFDHIHVVRPKMKMIRAYAGWVVARMQNVQTVIDGAVGQLPCNSRGRYRLSKTDIEEAIALTTEGALIFPASVSFFDTLPELAQRLSSSVLISALPGAARVPAIYGDHRPTLHTRPHWRCHSVFSTRSTTKPAHPLVDFVGVSQEVLATVLANTGHTGTSWSRLVRHRWTPQQSCGVRPVAALTARGPLAFNYTRSLRVGAA